jgi:DNA-binding NtrC family response regulator
MTANAAEAVATAVDATKFVTASGASAEAFKTANLLKLLTVNALVTGKRGTGKLSLARHILPDAPIIDASRFDELLVALQSNASVIITHIERTPNFATLFEQASKSAVRIVATGSDSFAHDGVDELFTVKVYLPPLCDRPEDVEALKKQYVQEARTIFGEGKEADMEAIEADLSDNAASLRRQIYLNYLLGNIAEHELMQIMEDYLYDRLGSNNDYRNFLHLYEAPLIKAGLKRFKSQLQLSAKLGLNRNTLRKKIADNKEYGLDE